MRRPPNPSRMALHLSFIFVLGINKQFDLQTALTEAARMCSLPRLVCLATATTLKQKIAAATVSSAVTVD
jgi:hypothetical protein